MTHQEALLRRALEERGEDPDTVELVHHLAGTAELDGGRCVGLVYPDSFFTRTLAVVRSSKDIIFFFRGSFKSLRGRNELLEAFATEREGTVLEASEWGRRAENKGEFDVNYFVKLSRARFGLCPHHPDLLPRFDSETAWTYRFADCCLVGAIPVLFREAPLGQRFVAGFHYVWDDQDEFTYDEEKATWNRELAERCFKL